MSARLGQSGKRLTRFRTMVSGNGFSVARNMEIKTHELLNNGDNSLKES